MANRAGIDTSISNLLAEDHQILFLAVKAEFDSGAVRVWSGDGEYRRTGIFNEESVPLGSTPPIFISRLSLP